MKRRYARCCLGLPEDAETRLVTLNIEYRRLGFSAACAELEVHFNRKEGWSKISKKKGVVERFWQWKGRMVRAVQGLVSQLWQVRA